MNPRRRRRPANPATVAYAIISLIVFAYALLLPLAEYWLSNVNPEDAIRHAGLTLPELIRNRAMVAFFVLWIFFFGSAIGSFLNVVAYRMPRGESIAHRASHCPYCATPIESRDNVPVFGWLGLRGRCRACRLPISRRYPIVEAICGALFLWIASVELLSAGANLPGDPPSRWAGLAFVLFDPQWDLIGLSLLHCLLASMLLVWCLLDIDAAPTARWFPTVGWLGALATALVNPLSHPVAWVSTSPGWLAQSPSWLSLLITPSLGLVFGSLAGAASREADDSKQRTRRKVLAASVAGAILGWQAAVLISATSTLICLFGRRLKRRSPWFPALLAVSLAYISLWKYVAAPRDFLFQQALWPLCLAGFGLLVHWFVNRPTESPPDGLAPDRTPDPSTEAKMDAAATEPDNHVRSDLSDSDAAPHKSVDP